MAKAADWAGFAARKAASAKAGKLRGIGMATYVEACGGAPDESAQVRFERDGGVSVLIGNQTNGQGHETAYAQLITEKLGVPFESVRVIQGDTDEIAYGHGTGGSRALSVGGTAILDSSQKIIDKGFKVRLPRTLFRPIALPATVEQSVEFQGKVVSLNARPIGLRVTRRILWYGVEFGTEVQGLAAPSPSPARAGPSAAPPR